MPLTDTHIRSLKPEEMPRMYFDGPVLFLYVPQTGSKLWRMSSRFEGKAKLLSYDGYRAVSLKDARARREEAKGLLAKGIDPPAQKKPPGRNGSRSSGTVLKISPWNGIKRDLWAFCQHKGLLPAGTKYSVIYAHRRGQASSVAYDYREGNRF